MPDDLERHLEAFGRTLREGTGEPIQPDHGGTPVIGAPRSTRRWALLGAAACVVVAVVGIGLAVGNRASAPGEPADGSTRNDDGAERPVGITSDAEPVPADPLGLERDGWVLVRRSTERFSMGADELPCEVDGLAAIDGIDQVHDILAPPGGDGLDLDVQILDVGSVDRGNALADAIMVIGRCLGDADGIEIDTGALSSVRASWFRAGPDFALVTIVGDGPRSIVLEIEGAPFDDDLIGELAHRADDFLGGRPVEGTPPPTVAVGEGTAVGEQQVEPDAGQVKLWVGNQSFDDDPVAITVTIDAVTVVDDSFAVGSQHNWFSFFIDGLAAGEHTIIATSDSGAEFEGTFTLPADEARWTVIDYWYVTDAAEGRFFTFRESNEPIYFA